MKKVSVNSLQENTYINQPVFLDENYILLSPEIPINSELLSRLKKWSYKEILTDGQASASPATSSTSEESDSGTVTATLDSDVKDNEHKQEADDIFNNTVKFLSEVFKRYKTKEEIRISSMTEKVKELIHEIKTNKRFILNFFDKEISNSDYIVIHSVKTAILCLALGEHFKLPPHKQIELGTSALLHRIGMLRIPPQIYLSNKVLTPKERKTIMAHPIIGFKALKASGFPMTISLAVLEHCEHIDGSGYPRKLTGDKLTFYSKVIAVAGDYTAAVSIRPYKSGNDGHTAIMDLLKDTGKKYEEAVIRALVRVLSIYPVGTYILLSNGSKGCVVETDPDNPKFPKVRLYTDENNTEYNDKPILQTRPTDNVKIIRPLNGEEIKALKVQ